MLSGFNAVTSKKRCTSSMLKFETNLNKYESEMRDIIRLFIPFFAAELSISAHFKDSVLTVCIDEKAYAHILDCELKVFCKIALYRTLSEYLGVSLPWGSLTGIRPTKMLHKIMQSEKVSLSGAKKALEEKYLVSEQKAQFAADIIRVQEEALLRYDLSDGINLYVHVPFCPSKCGYCSFVVVPIEKHRDLVKPYLDCLIKEILHAKEIIKAQGKRVLSVYIGGGTPTVLSAADLGSVLKAVRAAANIRDDNNIEFTVEAGRPDTFSPEKLQVLKNNRVTRVCINPQSFCDSTLQSIGRSHSSFDVLAAFDMAKEYGFDINTDLIAGLRNESLQDFKESVKSAVALRPANITVHTLSIKNGSDLFFKGREFNINTEAMVAFAETELAKNGYFPYYLYRQKNMSGNLHNTGFCLKDKECINNITTMEELVSVLACGAGAISKLVAGPRIERLANIRDVRLYIDGFDKLLEEKAKFFNSKIDC